MPVSKSVSEWVRKLNQVTHNVGFVLIPNTLSTIAARYVARLARNQTLNMEEVIVRLIARAGADVDKQEALDLWEKVKAEIMFDVADGYIVDLGVCTLKQSIGGGWESDNEMHDRKKHPIRFNFVSGREMRGLAGFINLKYEGLLTQTGEIMEIRDQLSGSLNHEITIGDYCEVIGRGLRVAAPKNPTEETGVWFVDEAGAATRCTPLADNGQKSLKFLVPAGLADGKQYKVRIVTYNSARSDSHLLKDARTVESDFSVTAKTTVTPAP